MQIAVLGLGRFGSSLVRELGNLDHEVLAVDSNEGRVQRTAPYCAKAAVADITDELALRGPSASGPWRRPSSRRACLRRACSRR